MAVQYSASTVKYQIAYQFTTKNQSFLDMHYYLRSKGVKNNAFFLALYDTDLEHINPRDPNLNLFMKRKVLAECMRNFWYFIREVVLIPDQGAEVGGGVKYKLHRGNLALNFGFVLNWNMFLELPRQHGKTISALVRYLWVFLFGTRNSEMMFMNKKLDDSKLNLQRMRDIRASLPEYLRLDQQFGIDGKKVKASNSVESLSNPANNNRIKTAPSARNKILANSLGRGCTIPLIYMDEYAFIPFNYIIYQSAIPAFSKASSNARNNRAPYGILITTTPGDLLTDEGKDAYDTLRMATEFSEKFYDLTLPELGELIQTNTKSSFIYMKYTYKQLGSTEEYFTQMVKDMKQNWAGIRREVLLEWSTAATNSPFEKVDLDMVKSLIREPIRELMIGRPNYIFKIYKDMNMYKHPPIVGVDVSGGYSKDSSTITVIDSSTTEVAAIFNCNSIPIQDLAKVIHELITVYMPNAIVNIERNGGFGASVLSYLLTKPEIKRNLYFEIKERTFEEKFDGFNTTRTKKKVKVYGLDQTKATRDKLMEILRERMTYHKDKFAAQRIYDELCELEVKRSGRIEHSANGHDDQLFSYLLALYVFYEGQNLVENFGLLKGSIKTEEFMESEEVIQAGRNMQDIGMEMIIEDEDPTDVASQLKYISTPYMTNTDLMNQQYKSSQDAMQQLIMTNHRALAAYCDKYNVSADEMQPDVRFTIPSSYLSLDDYDTGEDSRTQIQKDFDCMVNSR